MDDQFARVEVRAQPCWGIYGNVFPPLHIAINSYVNGLVLSIMDGIDTEWQAKSRTFKFSGTLQQIKKKMGSTSNKKHVPLANCGVPKY